jgi:hypothetical protein
MAMRRELPMKKLMTLMLGMALAFGCVSTTFAQDTPKKEKKTKKSKKKKGEEKKG